MTPAIDARPAVALASLFGLLAACAPADPSAVTTDGPSGGKADGKGVSEAVASLCDDDGVTVIDNHIEELVTTVEQSTRGSLDERSAARSRLHAKKKALAAELIEGGYIEEGIGADELAIYIEVVPEFPERMRVTIPVNDHSTTDRRSRAAVSLWSVAGDAPQLVHHQYRVPEGTLRCPSPETGYGVCRPEVIDEVDGRIREILGGLGDLGVSSYRLSPEDSGKIVAALGDGGPAHFRVWTERSGFGAEARPTEVVVTNRGISFRYERNGDGVGKLTDVYFLGNEHDRCYYPAAAAQAAPLPDELSLCAPSFLQIAQDYLRRAAQAEETEAYNRIDEELAAGTDDWGVVEEHARLYGVYAERMEALASELAAELRRAGIVGAEYGGEHIELRRDSLRMEDPETLGAARGNTFSYDVSLPHAEDGLLVTLRAGYNVYDGYIACPATTSICRPDGLRALTSAVDEMRRAGSLDQSALWTPGEPGGEHTAALAEGLESTLWEATGDRVTTESLFVLGSTVFWTARITNGGTGGAAYRTMKAVWSYGDRGVELLDVHDSLGSDFYNRARCPVPHEYDEDLKRVSAEN